AEATAEPVARPPQVPTFGQLSGYPEPDIVRGAAVAGSGISEPDNKHAIVRVAAGAALLSPAGAPAPEEAQGYSPPESPSDSSAASPSAASSSPTTPGSASTSAVGSASTRGGVRVASVTSSRSSATNSTPSGGVSTAS